MDPEFIIRTSAGIVLTAIVSTGFFILLKREFHPALIQSLRFRRQLVFIVPIFAVLVMVILLIFLF